MLNGGHTHLGHLSVIHLFLSSKQDAHKSVHSAYLKMLASCNFGTFFYFPILISGTSKVLCENTLDEAEITIVFLLDCTKYLMLSMIYGCNIREGNEAP